REGYSCTMIDYFANIANTLTNSLNSTELLPSPIWLITFIFLVAIVRLLKFFSFPEKPHVTYRHKTSLKGEISIAEVLEKCPILNETYNPPLLWGRNGHIQTATYGLLGHVSLRRTFDSRHLVKLPDGSSVVFDIFEPRAAHCNGQDFTLALCPGIANSSESNYIRTCVHYAQEKGYRCAVLNHLGALPHIALTSPRIFSYGGIEELEAMMGRLSEIYPKTRFISIGFSMGGNITTRFLLKAKQSLLDKVVLGLSVCQGYCAATFASLYCDWENGRRAYSYIITENMKRLLRRNYDMAVAPHVKSKIIDEQRLWSATSIVALDESYNRRVLGFSSVAEFYKACSCLHDLHRINIPMVFVNALDDPLVPPLLWEPVRHLAASNSRFGFVMTKHGGHLGFLEGTSLTPNSVTWLDRFIVELADAAAAVFDS
uniref:AB hydrolase-1 domain-containing protein n=2 Tax=Parascaris TaxID=6254 RepID=A0A915AG45_PARUN